MGSVPVDSLMTETFDCHTCSASKKPIHDIRHGDGDGGSSRGSNSDMKAKDSGSNLQCEIDISSTYFFPFLH